MALLSEILTRLTSQSVGGGTSTASWYVVGRDFSEDPDQQIVVTPSGGFPQYAAEFLDRPTFQVRVRGGKPSSASSTGLEGKLSDVDDALNLTGRVTLSSWLYLDIEKQGDWAFLGRDANQRPIYSANYVAFRSRTS